MQNLTGPAIRVSLLLLVDPFGKTILSSPVLLRAVILAKIAARSEKLQQVSSPYTHKVIIYQACGEIWANFDLVGITENYPTYTTFEGMFLWVKMFFLIF